MSAHTEALHSVFMLPSRAETGISAIGWVRSCRFYSHCQAQSLTGLDGPGTGQFNLSGVSGSGKSIQLLKMYTGKMARAGRDKDEKLYVSRKHASGMGLDSPGPAKYAPKLSIWDDSTSRYSRHGGCAFGKSVRPPLARVVF
jgi:hypothetical protein